MNKFANARISRKFKHAKITRSTVLQGPIYLPLCNTANASIRRFNSLTAYFLTGIFTHLKLRLVDAIKIEVNDFSVASPAKHLYTICTVWSQHLRRWFNIVRMLYCTNILCLLGRIPYSTPCDRREIYQPSSPR